MLLQTWRNVLWCPNKFLLFFFSNQNCIAPFYYYYRHATVAAARVCFFRNVWSIEARFNARKTFEIRRIFMRIVHISCEINTFFCMVRSTIFTIKVLVAFVCVCECSWLYMNLTYDICACLERMYVFASHKREIKLSVGVS